MVNIRCSAFQVIFRSAIISFLIAISEKVNPLPAQAFVLSASSLAPSRLVSLVCQFFIFLPMVSLCVFCGLRCFCLGQVGVAMWFLRAIPYSIQLLLRSRPPHLLCPPLSVSIHSVTLGVFLSAHIIFYDFRIFYD